MNESLGVPLLGEGPTLGKVKTGISVCGDGADDSGEICAAFPAFDRFGSGAIRRSGCDCCCFSLSAIVLNINS